MSIIYVLIYVFEILPPDPFVSANSAVGFFVQTTCPSSVHGTYARGTNLEV